MSYLECANGCTIRDEHLDTCTNELCRGCLPKPAQVGCLCARDWYALEVAWSEWAILEPFLAKYARLSPRNEDGSRSPAGPSIPLPQTILAWDECRSWLRSEPQNARSWVSTVDGAVQAVGFTRAVQRAARAHIIEERSHQLQRMRCPDCGLIVAWMPPRYAGDEVSVQCDGCGRRITETEQWKAWRRTSDPEQPWERYETPAIDVIAQIETRRKA